MIIPGITLQKLKTTVSRVGGDNGISETDRIALILHTASQVQASEGDQAAQTFLEQFSGLQSVNDILVRSTADAERGSSADAIQSYKSLVISYIEHFNNIEDSSGIFITLAPAKFAKPDQTSTRQAPYEELLKVVGLKIPEDKAEAENLIREIQDGIHNANFNEAIDQGKFTEWSNLTFL